MFTTQGAFSGFSVDDVDAARAYYRDTLGLEVRDDEMGFIELVLPSGGMVLELPSDEKGIVRGMGPDIAWFRDPAGNVLAVIQS